MIQFYPYMLFTLFILSIVGQIIILYTQEFERNPMSVVVDLCFNISFLLWSVYYWGMK